jgi:transposase InsO family protein
MQEKDREKIALFRYGIIAPILNGQVESKQDYLAEICSQVHQVPYRGAREYKPKTIEEWLRIYGKEGFDGLKPKSRSDKGQARSIPAELKGTILELREQRRDLPVSMFYDLLVQKGTIKVCDFSYSTVYRLLKKHDLVGKEKRNEPERRRFAHDRVNVLWQTDTWNGPYLKDGGKKKPTYLIAFIDDCSRIVPAARFSFTEKTEDLMRVFEEGLLRRGIPKMVYADNGKIYRSDQFQLACASQGISLLHTRVQDPAAKGYVKIFVMLRFSRKPLHNEVFNEISLHNYLRLNIFSHCFKSVLLSHSATSAGTISLLAASIASRFFFISAFAYTSVVLTLTWPSKSLM